MLTCAVIFFILLPLLEYGNSVMTLREQVDWYSATTRDGKIRQVVFAVPMNRSVPPEFGTLLLNFDRFPVLASESWSSGFFRLDGKPNPYLMVRVADLADDVRSAPVSVAFSFCQTSAGGVFLISVRIESEEVGTLIRSVHPHLPPLRYPVAEWMAGFDDPYQRQLIADSLACGELHLVFARNCPTSSSTVYLPDGSTRSVSPPRAAFDVHMELTADATAKLCQYWTELEAHHARVPASTRSFQSAVEEVSLALPYDQDPILPHGAA